MDEKKEGGGEDMERVLGTVAVTYHEVVLRDCFDIFISGVFMRRPWLEILIQGGFCEHLPASSSDVFKVSSFHIDMTHAVVDDLSRQDVVVL